jgi:lipoprotein-releasing system permease protein
VVVSVVAFIVVESVMSGLSRDLQSKILGFSSHAVLTPDSPQADFSAILSQLQKMSQVKASRHYLEGEAVLRTEDGANQGVKVRGIEAGHPFETQDMKVFFEEGEGWDTLAGTGAQLPGVLLGAELASTLGVLPALFEKVELLYPFGDVGPTGEVEPNRRAFRVVGVFRSGYYEYDSKYLIAPLPEALLLFGDSQTERIGVFLRDPAQVSKLKSYFKNIPQVASVKTWQEQHARLFSALRLERLGMSLVLGLMMVLATFNILSMLMMVVFERRREIAVLRSLGLSQRDIGGIFYRAGLWIGLLGTCLGMAIGIALCLWLGSAELRLPTPYYLEALPVDLRWTFLVSIFLGVPLIAVLATGFPARESRGVSIIDALRYE